MTRRAWRFTHDERTAIRVVYEALTRVGNETRDAAKFPTDVDHWDPVLDHAHHHLGLVLAHLYVADLTATESDST